MELTRVSVVDGNGVLLYDTLVKPHNKITDYNTRWSGITEATLQNVKTTLEDVQRKLLTIITKDTILVGHSLENDLAALKMFHDRVIDTSLLFPKNSPSSTTEFAHKHGLKHLAQKYLGKVIQDGAHDSIQDATTALELAVLKINRSKELAEIEASLRGSLFGELSKNGVLTAMADTTHFLAKHTPTVSLPCANDDEVCAKVGHELRTGTSQYVFAQLHGLKTAFDYEGQPTNGDSLEKLKHLSGHINTIHTALPPNTLFMVLTGSADYMPLKNRGGVGGTTIVDPVEKARRAVAFISITK
jgi:RNA exonuclease 1